MDHRDQSSNQANLQQQQPFSSNLNITEESSPRKPHGSGGGDRIKRDEWSEGAVNALLEAYESKWALRNRAKLKGQDWEDVARHVSSRCGSDSSSTGKSAKTQTQCKNKIESMKKRYRLESSSHQHNSSHGSSSTWPLYSRLDRLLRGSGVSGGGGGSGPSSPLVTCAVPVAMQPVQVKTTGESSGIKNPGSSLVESRPVVPPPPPLPPLATVTPSLPPPPAPTRMTVVELEQNSPQSDGPTDQFVKEDRVSIEEGKELEQLSSDRNILDTDDSTSTPALYKSNNSKGSKRTRSSPPTKSKPTELGKKRKRRRRIRGDDQEVDNIAESIQWLAEAVTRTERSRMDTIRELERMRVEAEVKRGEMDLKRTEIIANTQLEIARLFTYSRAADGGRSGGDHKNGDSSPKIRR